MGKVDAWQVFWSLITMLVSYVAIMVTLFRNELKNSKKEQAEACEKYRKACEQDCLRSRMERDRNIERVHKEAIDLAREIEGDLSKCAHVHGSLGAAGEVIPK